ncbi:MAG: division/cell wall cluster transcriptional repressor MraZ [Anaerofustis sp.]
MLGGEYRHAIDEKGRVSIPVKFRNDLGNVFVISKGIGEDCLFVFTLLEWRRLEEKIRKLPLTDKKARRFSRYLVGGATECEVDKQGRAMIPQYLRDYAGLKKEVVLVGLTTRVEIWDAQQWDEYNNPDNHEFGIEDDMESLGI